MIQLISKLYNSKGEIVKHEDLQDKASWCEKGRSSEDVFVKKYGNELNLIINPEKKWNKYTVDLKNIQTENFADLKTQHTPFFQALERYSIDPQYAVTFNKKDYLRYSEFYPDIEVYFWVEWLATKFENEHKAIEVNPMDGVWKISFDNIKDIVDDAPLHYYGQRIFDTSGNSKGSYVFDLRHPLFNKLY